MDAFTENHLNEWIALTVHESERHEVQVGIRKYLTKNPEVIEWGWSWPEIRSVAEREGYIE